MRSELELVRRGLRRAPLSLLRWLSVFFGAVDGGEMASLPCDGLEDSVGTSGISRMRALCHVQGQKGVGGLVSS